mgnify:CR=1 FL=1
MLARASTQGGAYLDVFAQPVRLPGNATCPHSPLKPLQASASKSRVSPAATTPDPQLLLGGYNHRGAYPLSDLCRAATIPATGCCRHPIRLLPLALVVVATVAAEVLRFDPVLGGGAFFAGVGSGAVRVALPVGVGVDHTHARHDGRRQRPQWLMWHRVEGSRVVGIAHEVPAMPGTAVVTSACVLTMTGVWVWITCTSQACTS